MPVMDVWWFCIHRVVYIDGVCPYQVLTLELGIYRGADKSLARPTCLSIVFFSPGNRW
jgi:hypothetical protein